MYVQLYYKNPKQLRLLWYFMTFYMKYISAESHRCLLPIYYVHVDTQFSTTSNEQRPIKPILKIANGREINLLQDVN